MENVLFISSLSTQFNALLPLAETINSSGKYNPVFFIDTSRWPVTHEIEKCKEKGIDFIIDRQNYPLSTYQKTFSRMILKLKFISIIFKYLSYYYDNIVLARKVLTENKYKFIFLPGDANFNYMAPFFVKAANRLKIVTAVFPFSFCNQEETVCRFKNTSEYDVNTFSKRLFVALLPKWKYDANGRLMIRKSIAEAIAVEILGCSPENPWMYIGGNSSKILVESEFVKDYYIESGVNKNKIEVIGTLYPDRKNATDKDHIEKDNNVHKKIVVCSLPPDLDNQEMFSTHEEMTRFWVQSLNQRSVHLIISLHPRLALKDFLYIRDEYGVEISGKPINELIESCDIFAAGASATIRAALTYKKITLNFDPFFNFTTFFNIPMVIFVRTKEDFIAEYEKLIMDQKYFEDLRKSYDNYSENYFGFLNNNYVQDIFNSIK